jgi:hypothetical protein
MRELFSSTSLASRNARSRSMFLRTAMAFCSTSTIARAPSSAAKRCRLARAMRSGEGSVDFLPSIFSQFCNKQSPLNPGIERALPPFQYIREMALTVQASDRFSALTLPRILSVLIS